MFLKIHIFGSRYLFYNNMFCRKYSWCPGYPVNSFKNLELKPWSCLPSICTMSNSTWLSYLARLFLDCMPNKTVILTCQKQTQGLNGKVNMMPENKSEAAQTVLHSNCVCVLLVQVLWDVIPCKHFLLSGQKKGLSANAEHMKEIPWHRGVLWSCVCSYWYFSKVDSNKNSHNIRS